MMSKVIAALQTFVAVGAIPAGIAFLTDPSGRGLGMTVELLQGSPFADFLVPGIVLLGIHGIGSLLGAAMSLWRVRFAGDGAVLLGSLLGGWMVVQIVLIGMQSPFQVLMVWTALAEVGLGLAFRQELGRKT